jgi:hypothetical protein
MHQRWWLGWFRPASLGILLAVLAGASLASCGGSGSSAGVPSLHHDRSAAGSTGQNARALHVAAQCLRVHGIPNYADPTVGPGQVVYTDQRDLEKVGDAVVQAAMSACRSVIGQANFDPTQRPHPPARMVRDGVREAQCLRAHGLPNWPDPKPTDTFDPGHGFQVTDAAFAGAVPAGTNPKASSVFQHAIEACQTEAQAVSSDSELSNLGHGQ